MAVEEVPSATMVMRGSKRRTSSSSTKTAPAIGALNATARPAPAPEASSIRSSSWEWRNRSPMRWATTAPICTLGPSRPSAMPEPIAESPPRNLTGSSFGGAGGSSPLSAASTCGMPLPDACGENRRTSQAPNAAAAVHPATTSTKPRTCASCPRVSRASRSRSASSRVRRKIASTNPAPAPTTGASKETSHRRRSFRSLSGLIGMWSSSLFLISGCSFSDFAPSSGAECEISSINTTPEQLPAPLLRARRGSIACSGVQ